MEFKLSYVSEDENNELTTISGDTLDEVFEQANEFLAEEGYIDEDAVDEAEWIEGDAGEGYSLTVTNEDGDELTFVLE